MSSYDQNFSNLKSMVSELSKTVSSDLIRYLVIFSQFLEKNTKIHKFVGFLRKEKISIL